MTAPRNRTVCQLTGQQADPEALRPSRFFTALTEVIPGALERVTAERDELLAEVELLRAKAARVDELEVELADMQIERREWLSTVGRLAAERDSWRARSGQ